MDMYEMVNQAVTEAIKPFRPGRIVLSAHDSFWGFSVWTVYAENIPGVRFIFDESRLSYLRSPEELMWDFARNLYAYFHNLRALPIGDNIVLGEN